MTAWQSSERLKPELENSPFSKPDSNESQSTRGISPKEMEPTNGDGHERTLLERTNTRDSSESRIRVCQPVPRRRNVCASNMQTAGTLFDGFRSVSFSSQSSSDLSGTESENLSSSLSGRNRSVNFSPKVEIVNSDPSARTEIPELTLRASFSSRSLDHLLEGDHVFGHYRAILAGYPGWCPMETDYTVSVLVQLNFMGVILSFFDLKITFTSYFKGTGHDIFV
ncbi:hypothetical protein DPMN_004141 [Dreissena polymorpha]|uniref:Uncharacterized protein n=1 Tax=Dreissena polymorpha TaxID=45954 RepID=A0A9D4RSR2_DREPO|nr:hypothetical protein DPMN_004141 [Dreissena polymorpha]